MIDYKLLASAQAFYENLNYMDVPVTWIVPLEYLKVTMPPGKRAFLLSNEYALVGSAEQSFIMLMDKENLYDYKLQAITPCFRDEEEETKYTKMYFMKLELIHINPLVETYEHLITDAETFFTNMGLPVERVKTKEGEDLFYKDIELGSYGIRSYKNNVWAYGTGCAEPRTSLCLKDVAGEDI